MSVFVLGKGWSYYTGNKFDPEIWRSIYADRKWLTVQEFVYRKR